MVISQVNRHCLVFYFPAESFFVFKFTRGYVLGDTAVTGKEAEKIVILDEPRIQQNLGMCLLHHPYNDPHPQPYSPNSSQRCMGNRDKDTTMWEAKAPGKEPGREKGGGEGGGGGRARDWQGHSPTAKGKLKNSKTSAPMDKRWSCVCAKRGFPLTKSRLSALSSTTQCKAPQVSVPCFSLFQSVCLALSPSLFPHVCTVATKTTRYG